MTTPFKRNVTLSVAAGLFALSIPFAALADNPTASVAPTTVTTTANTITQDQAVAAVKNFYPLPDGYVLSNASFEGPNGFSFSKNGVWSINYENSRPDPDTPHEELMFTVDGGTGKVISMFSTGQDSQDSAPSISTAASQQLATDLLKKLAPDQADNVQILDNGSTSEDPSSLTVLSYNFVRVVNGVPFPYNHVTIRLSPSGKLIGYENMWSDDLTFPAATPAVSQDQAQATYDKSLQLSLQYELHYANSEEPTSASLVYTPYGSDGFGSFPTLDATSGQVIDSTGQPLDLQAPSFQPVTDQQTPVPTQEYTRDDVLKLVAQYPMSLDDYQLQSSTYQKSGDGQDPQWQLTYSKDGNENLNLSIDAKTGDLDNLFRPNAVGSSPSASSLPPKVTFDQAKQKATDWVIKALPSSANQYTFDPSSASLRTQDGTYLIRFLELHNGIPTNQSINLNIDTQTGDIVSFFTQYSGSVTYPDASQAISVDRAKQDYQNNKQFALTLQYIPLFAGDNPKMDQPTKIELVYAPAPMLDQSEDELDALTEEWISPYIGAPTDASSITDIKGNWAEKYMTNFLQQGIYTPKNHQLLPNQAVTRGEGVRALVMISHDSISTLGTQPFFTDVQPDAPYFTYVQQAVRFNWIETDSQTFRPDDKLTREDLAVWVADSLGYSDLTKVPGAVVNHFTDMQNVDPEHVNDIAIASALQFMVGNGHTFRPHDTVTRAELAAVLTHLSDHLQQRYPY